MMVELSELEQVQSNLLQIDLELAQVALTIAEASALRHSLQMQRKVLLEQFFEMMQGRLGVQLSAEIEYRRNVELNGMAPATGLSDLIADDDGNQDVLVGLYYDPDYEGEIDFDALQLPSEDE